MGAAAFCFMRKTEGITLDGNDSGKAMAALVSDARKGGLKGKSVPFWDTYNSRPACDSIPLPEYHQLPECFHMHFEKPVQPLDQQ